LKAGVDEWFVVAGGSHSANMANEHRFGDRASRVPRDRCHDERAEALRCVERAG
jgi:hypothetical protein